jgi:hypothetical protein
MTSLPDDFDWITYIYFYDDLKDMNINDAYYHYIGYGCKENRLYKFDLPEDFNWKDYYYFNKDIISNEIFKNTFGNENSNYEDLYNFIYNKNNNDLENMELLEKYAKKHYTLWGKTEGRQYKFNLPSNFNWLDYISNNNDLIGLNELDAKIHYVSFGVNEKRKYIDYSISKVYVICNIKLGGTSKYINDILNSFPEIKFLFLTEKKQINGIKFKDTDIIFVQQLIMTTIFPEDIIYIKNTYNSKIVISIHDFCWFNKEIIHNFGIDPYHWHGKYIENNVIINESIKKLFSIANDIIHPSLFTYNLYSKYFDKTNFKLVYHNDNIINDNINNFPIIKKEINIGVLHSFSIYKGKEIINILMDKFPKYKKYKINFLISDFTIEKYNEDNFNDIIKKYNIHCLLCLNKWGETYCYALTKYLNSGLPILYNNIGAFQDRIPKKEKYKILLESESEYEDFITNPENQIIAYNKFISFLDYIIFNNIDTNYNFNENNFIVKKYYYDLFLNNIINKNIVIITSKIYVSNNEFSYTKNRSIYTKDERYDDTMITINSVKEKIKDSYVILFDNSLFSQDEYNNLKNSVDCFINITNDDDLNFYTNKFKYKAFSEMFQLIKCYEYFLSKINKKHIKNIFKISGRYYLNDDFDYNNFDNNDNIFKRNNDLNEMKYYYTSFYKISVDFCDEYFKLLNKTFQNKDRYLEMNLEEIIPEIINYNFKEIDCLGLTQKIAVWNQIDEV